MVTVCPEHHVAIQHAHAFGLPVRIALVVEQLPDLKLVVDPLQTLRPRFYQALRDIASKEGGMGEDESAAWVKALQKEKRYLKDVY